MLNIKILLLQFLFSFRNKPDHHLWILRFYTTNNFWPTGHISDYWKIFKHTHICNVSTTRALAALQHQYKQLLTASYTRDTVQIGHTNANSTFVLADPAVIIRSSLSPSIDDLLMTHMSGIHFYLSVFEPKSYETAYQTNNKQSNFNLPTNKSKPTVDCYYNTLPVYYSN